jgi:hypothetical protein
MVNYIGSLGEEMSTPDIITKNPRSEGAKKMWERRKSQEGEKKTMEMTLTNPWIFHVEWLALMATLIGCFMFVHRENSHLTERLDNHIEAINRRTDQISADTNRRCDELHKEFYELLKEMRK